MFSRSIEEECSPYGVHVQTLYPGFVSQTDKNPLIPSIDVYVHHAVSTLPFTHYTTGYWLHSLQVSCVRTILIGHNLTLNKASFIKNC